VGPGDAGRPGGVPQRWRADDQVDQPGKRVVVGGLPHHDSGHPRGNEHERHVVGRGSLVEHDHDRQPPGTPVRPGHQYRQPAVQPGIGLGQGAIMRVVIEVGRDHADAGQGASPGVRDQSTTSRCAGRHVAGPAGGRLTGEICPGIVPDGVTATVAEVTGPRHRLLVGTGGPAAGQRLAEHRRPGVLTGWARAAVRWLVERGSAEDGQVVGQAGMADVTPACGVSIPPGQAPQVGHAVREDGAEVVILLHDHQDLAYPAQSCPGRGCWRSGGTGMRGSTGVRGSRGGTGLLRRSGCRTGRHQAAHQHGAGQAAGCCHHPRSAAGPRS
jgi:hypothetical protein